MSESEKTNTQLMISPLPNLIATGLIFLTVFAIITCRIHSRTHEYLCCLQNFKSMTKREFTGKGGETWTWEETPEVTEALKQLHDRVRRAKL